MRGAERVVDVDLAQTGELGGERRVVLLLPLVEAQVLDEQDLPVGEGLRRGERALAAHVVHIGDGPTQQLAQAVGDRPHRIGLLEAGPRGAAEVAHEHDAGPAPGRKLDGRKGARGARVVGDGAVRDGNVEVHADEHALAAHLCVRDALLRDMALLTRCSSAGAPAGARSAVRAARSGPPQSTPPNAQGGAAPAVRRAAPHRPAAGSPCARHGRRPPPHRTRRPPREARAPA